MDKAILITYDKEDAINEAKGLCEAAGYEVVHIIQENYLLHQPMLLCKQQSNEHTQHGDLRAVDLRAVELLVHPAWLGA